MPEPEFDVFLSHASSDKPAVEKLALILESRRIRPWFDKWHLKGGDLWLTEIGEALEGCAACAVCIGPNGFGKWQTEEMNLAIENQVTSRRGRVIPVFLPGAVLPGADQKERATLPWYLRSRMWVDFCATLDNEDALQTLIGGIRRERRIPTALAKGTEGTEETCPYRGLKYFDVGDSAFFYGREKSTEWLLAKVQPTRYDQRFFAILGPSGSGKSSLARAGLLAALKNGYIHGSQHWPHVIFTPGTHPLENLASALTPNDSPTAVIQVSQLAKSFSTDSHTLHLMTSLALRDSPDERYLVLLIDQFEEVFTLCKDEAQRQALIDNLLYAAREPAGRTLVVLTLRSDFYGHCADYPELAASFSDKQELVGPMTEKELRSAIEGPARDAGLELEGGLVDLLISKIQGETAGLPLLQHALRQIWERREASGLMTRDAYHEIGGVDGALQGHAEKIFSDLTKTKEEEKTCRRVLLCLVQVNNQQRATKRRLSRDTLIQSAGGEADRKAIETVVSRFTTERLFTTSGDKDHSTVEIAHEALLTVWKRLADWIQDEQQDIQFRDRLEEDAREWIDNNRDPSYLYSGARLSPAENWKARHSEGLSEDAEKFIAVAVAQRTEEEARRTEEEARKRRQRRRVMALLSAAVVVAGVIAFMMFRLWRESDRRLRIYLATQMAGQAKLSLQSNPLISLLLGIEAVRLQEDLPLAQEALLDAVARADGRPFGKPGIVVVAPSADRRTLATASQEGTVVLWDLEPEIPREVRSLDVKGKIKRLAVSSDRRWLLSSNQDADVRLWDLKKEDQGIPLPDENWRPGDPFSPDSRWLITQRLDKPVLRSLGSDTQPQELKEWPREAEGLRSTADSDDTTFSVYATSGRAIIAQSVDEVNIRLTLPFDSKRMISALGQPIHRLFFVPGGRRLVSQASNEAPRLWDLTRYTGMTLAATPEGTRRAVRKSAADFVEIVDRAGAHRRLQGVTVYPPEDWAFTADGKRLAACRLEDKAVFVWDLSSGSLVPRTLSLGSAVTRIAFDPEGQFLAIGGHGVVWRWDLKSREPEVVAHDHPPRPISALALSSNPPSMATGSDKGRVVLFGPFKDLSRPTAITALAFSPDGKVLAIAEASGKALLWSEGKAEIPLQNRNARVLAFSKDGHWLAGGGEDGTVQLWDLSKDRPSGVPIAWKGHPGAVRSLAFTDDGKELITTGATDSVRRWPLDPDEMIRVACARAGEGRSLTIEEWSRHAPAGGSFREGAPCAGVGPPRYGSAF